MSNEETMDTIATETADEVAPDASVSESTEASDKPEVSAAESDNVDNNAVAEENAGDANADKQVADAAASEISEKREKQAKRDKNKPASKGMSKLFKLIYFPALALFTVIMLVFSIVDGVYGYKPKAYGEGYYQKVQKHIEVLAADSRSSMTSGGISYAKDYIVSALTEGGFTEADEEKSGEYGNPDELVTTVTDWQTVSNVPVPTVTVMTARPDVALQNGMKTGSFLVGTEITNIIAAIPSKTTKSRGAVGGNADKKAGSVVITVRYDTRPDTAGAADNAAFTAVAVQSLIEYAKSGADFDRDIIVVFTEELDRSYGTYSFFESFKGFDNAAERAEVGVSLDAYGNRGTLALTDASGAGLDYINAYTKISGKTFNSSLVADSIPEYVKAYGAIDAFGDVPAIQVAVLGGLDAFGSLTDTASDIGKSIIYQEADFFKSYVDAFGKSTKKLSAETDRTLTHFSYFDAGTVAYNDIAAYVVGAMILALIGAAIAVIVVKKAFSIKKLLIALGVEALVVVSTLVAMFGAYFLITLMLTGFGVLPIHAITQLRYFNAGIFIAAMVIAVASAFGFTTLYKKLFKVTASDTVRGTALLFGLVGAVMSFAVPAYSYVASWVGLLLNAVLLVTACLNGKLKERFGIGFDRLFVFVLPIALCMPFMMSALSMLTVILPLYMLPVTMTVFTAMLGVAVPYLDRTATVFDKVAKKLPMRTQRVQRVVTEKVEDRAKKGKFTERTVKRIDKEKVAVSYKNYFGVSVLAVLGIVIALFSGGFGVTFGQTVTATHSYDRAIYNDSLVYEWDKSSSGEVTQKIIVDDLVAYKYIRNAVTDLKWDAANEYYYKTVYYKDTEIIANAPTVTRDGKHYDITTFDGAYSYVTLTIESAQRITDLKITSNVTNKEFEYKFFEQEEITLRLPYGFGNFSIDVELESGTSAPSVIRYEEVRAVAPNSEDRAMDNIDEWNAVLNAYRDQDVLDHLRGGIVLKQTFSL